MTRHPILSLFAVIAAFAVPTAAAAEAAESGVSVIAQLAEAPVLVTGAAMPVLYVSGAEDVTVVGAALDVTAYDADADVMPESWITFEGLGNDVTLAFANATAQLRLSVDGAGNSIIMSLGEQGQADVRIAGDGNTVALLQN